MATLGLTQASLAAGCGVELRTLQRWFAGQRVALAAAEKLACELGIGTAELFSGVPDETPSEVYARIGKVARMLGARDNAFAQGLRLVREHFDSLRTAVSFASHPPRGFVARQPVLRSSLHGFVQYALDVPDESDIELRSQLGRQFGYVVARLRVRGARAALIETFSTRSMLAERMASGTFALWLWAGPEVQEWIAVSDRELRLSLCQPEPQQQLDLDAPEMRHALCVRPNAMHLRAAGLPMGFDRVIGERARRMDVAVDW